MAKTEASPATETGLGANGSNRDNMVGIRITREHHATMQEIGRMGDSFDDVIGRLLTVYFQVYPQAVPGGR